MNEAETIIERMKIVTSTSSNVELSKILEINPVIIANWKKNNTVPYRHCVKLCELNLELSLDYLILDKEQKFITYHKKNSINNVFINPIDKKPHSPFNEKLMLKILEAQKKMGFDNSKGAIQIYNYFEHQSTPTTALIEDTVVFSGKS